MSGHIVRGYRFGTDDWEVLGEFVEDEAADMNRDTFDAMMLTGDLINAAEPNSQGRRENLLLLAVKDGQVTGIAAIRRGATDRDSHVGMLRLHVRAEYRSNGVGAKLMRRALWWADRNGITRVVATPYVEPSRHPWFDEVESVRFFARHDFTLEGLQQRAARLLDGTYTDVAVMARVIQPAKEDT